MPYYNSTLLLVQSFRLCANRNKVWFGDKFCVCDVYIQDKDNKGSTRVSIK